jgi:hypothetical protein
MLGNGAPGTDFGAGPTTNAPSARYAFVARYESTGTLLWQRMWADHEAHDVAVGGDGSVVATGMGYDGAPAGLSGLSDSWLPVIGSYVVKLDAGGSFRWVEVIPDAGGLAVAADATGQTLVVGSDFVAKLAP